ncbi:MAG: hypothetical protein ACE5HU_05985 [Acidobacteriota bacterium]
MLDLIWLIPVLPLAGFVVAGAGSLLGARSRGPVATVACGTVGLSFALSISCFWSLSRLPAGAQQHATTLAAWIEPLHVSWSFLLDPLSAVMILVVTGVGLLIHIYSIGYMWDEEGYWRYFAFLNLFMAMMLTLVLGRRCRSCSSDGKASGCARIC